MAMTLDGNGQAGTRVLDHLTSLVDSAGPGFFQVRSVAVDMVGNYPFPADSFNPSTNETTFARTVISQAPLPAQTVTGPTNTVDNYRVFGLGGTLLWSGTVTVTGGGGDMEVNDVNWQNGGTFQLTNWTIELPYS